jgi:hypothetical protein
MGTGAKRMSVARRRQRGPVEKTNNDAIYVEAIFNLFCDISRLTRMQYGRGNYVNDGRKQQMTMTMTMAGIHNREIYGNQQKGE